MEEEKYYAQWLGSLCCLNDRALRRLEEKIGGPAEVFGASAKALEGLLSPGQHRELLESREKYRTLEELKEVYERMEEQGIFFVWQKEETFPRRLLQIPDPPVGLYCRGSLPEEGAPAVAVIGARDCSEYGNYVADGIGRYLGEQGVAVISGMARGIDGISQSAALAAGGNSYGILGCGADICYPASQRKLYDRLSGQGGILSEYPPGTPPIPRNFPPRNRIVSGLADAVIVIEARRKSGTLITVDMALEQGKEVYVVPGRITDRLSDGCNMLLKQGAAIFLSPQEFLKEMDEVWERKRDGAKEAAATREAAGGEPSLPELPEPQKRVWQALEITPSPVEQIMRRLPGSYTCAQVHVALMQLCVRQLAAQVTPGCFCRKSSGE